VSDCVALAGRRFEHELTRAADGAPTLVFLHHGLGSRALWRDVPAALAARTGCGALVVSRLGHGESDPEPLPRPPDYLLREGRETLPALLAALELRDIVLVGHSDGGTIALAFLAAGHPARAAIVAAPHVFDEAVTWREIARQRALWPGALRAGLARYHRDPDATFGAWADFWLAPAFRGWSILPLLAAVRCPILAVQGEDDPYGSPAQIEAIAAHAPGPVRLEKLPACGHDPFRDRREHMLALCADFIAEA
jgi:pimeloyl-ACP methyl ester carboxylesterase